jgi:uncharacterized protein
MTETVEVIHLIVKPGSDKNSIEGLHDGRLKIKITSPPSKGKANKALIELISKKTKIPKKDIVIISGEMSNLKKIALKKKGDESILNLLLNNI